MTTRDTMVARSPNVRVRCTACSGLHKSAERPWARATARAVRAIHDDEFVAYGGRWWDICRFAPPLASLRPRRSSVDDHLRR